MSDPISSASWTGPSDEMSAPYRREFLPQVEGNSNAAEGGGWATPTRPLPRPIPPELLPLLRKAVWALISPIALWIGWLILRAASSDFLIQAHGSALAWWGVAIVGLAGWQLTSRSTALMGVRTALLSLAMFGTVFLSGAYVYLGLSSKSHTLATVAERTYEFQQTSGRWPFMRIDYFHQRADGTTVEGTNGGQPFDYGKTCALVQRLDGVHGFTWVRLIERSRAPARGQLPWPVRREECFSDIPLSTLPR